jgi:hypothetical protein
MTESEVEDALARFGRWLGHWYSRPVGKLALTALMCLSLAGCVQWDEHVRANGVKTLPMAPEREDFLLSLQFGAALGLVALLADLLHSLARQFARLFRVSQEREQPRLKRLRVTIGTVWVTSMSVLCFALFAALSGWCALRQVFPLPAWTAALAIIVPGLLLLDLISGAKRLDEPPQEVPVED